MIRKAIARSRLAASRLLLYCLALAISTCTAHLDASGEPVPPSIDGSAAADSLPGAAQAPPRSLVSLSYRKWLQ